MKKQIITWTVIPRSLTGPLGAGGTLSLSLFISPRLEADGTPTLSDFHDWLVWPETVAKLHFKVQFGGGPSLPAKVVSGKPDLDHWQALFTGATPITPFVFEDRTNQFIRSYPVARIQNDIKQRYQSVAKLIAEQKDPGSQPGSRQMYDLLADLVPPPSQEVNATRYVPPAMTQVINTALKRHKAIPNSLQPGGIPGDYHQADLFTHRQVGGLPPGGKAPRPTKAQVYDLFDFHKMVSALGNYPALLVRLGLVVELEVHFDAAIPSGAASTTIQVEPSQFAGPPNVRPLTHYLLDGTGFRAALQPGSPMTNALLLRLSDPSLFDVAQMDVDGAAPKLTGAAVSIERAFRNFSPGSSRRQTVPSLRSGGIALIHSGRAYDLAQRFATAATHNSNATGGLPVHLYADDLVRGYAIDIWQKQTGHWHGLNLRHGTYTFKHAPAGKQTVTLDDEGFVSMATAQSPTGTPDDLYLHEQLCRWNGWSLAAARPITPVGLAESAATPTDRTNPDTTRYGLVVDYSVPPGTLPKLRFGHAYRARARMVDLAGHGIDVKAPGAQQAVALTPLVAYLRWEPLVAPALALHNSIKGSPGESSARMVIRSDYDRSVDQYYADQSSPTYNKDAERHLLPPKTSEMMAETHGMFDVPPPAGTNWYDLIVKLDASLPLDPAPPHEPVPQGTDPLVLPYLPDPLAHGVSFVGLPGHSLGAPFINPTWDGTWPHLSTLRLLLKGIDANALPKPPHFAAGAAPLLTIELPKGEMVTVQYSSRLRPQALAMMALWRWIVEAGLAGFFLKAAEEGLVWLLTPAHELTLVHAVQRPLIEPGFSPAFHAARQLGKNSAVLQDAPMPISGRSTIKVDFTARWYEPIDDIGQPGPEVLNSHAHVSELPVSYPDTTVQFPADPTPSGGDSVKFFTHEIGNTKYHRISYTAIATTRYREYFPFTANELQAKPDLITRSSPTGALPKPEADQAKAASIVDAAHSLPRGVIDVPSSARPQSPRLLYVLPTFAHQSAAVNSGIGTIRRGGGLRVYLERPWYSSGEGELLGVVLPPLPERIRLGGHGIRVIPPRAPDASHYTQWGLDPIWFSHNAPTPLSPALSAFTIAARTGSGLSIDEQPGTAVSVAGHEVAYDADRRLWYADITLSGGLAYYPFIRLVLARYQPNSIANAHLSRLVLAEFAQIAPDRAATVIFNAQDPRRMQISVAGPAPYRTTNVVEVSLEQQIYADAAPDAGLGWTPVNRGTVDLPSTTVGNETLWTGTLTLPVLPSPPPPLRLVIREFELFSGTSPAVLNIPVRRLVYAEVLDVLLPG